MQNNEIVEGEHSLVAPPQNQGRSVDIPGTIPVRLQTLDLSRNVAIAPDGKRFVVATYNDSHIGRGYVTAAMPQQNDYLTLIRLAVCEISSSTPEEAMQRHVALAQAITRGQLNEFLRSLPEGANVHKV